jgi:transposase
MSATRHNPQMKYFYERLKANDKYTTVAQVAVMRKLIVIAHSLYKSGEMYNRELFISSCGIQRSCD